MDLVKEQVKGPMNMGATCWGLTVGGVVGHDRVEQQEKIGTTVIE